MVLRFVARLAASHSIEHTWVCTVVGGAASQNLSRAESCANFLIRYVTAQKVYGKGLLSSLPAPPFSRTYCNLPQHCQRGHVVISICNLRSASYVDCCDNLGENPCQCWYYHLSLVVRRVHPGKGKVSAGTRICRLIWT